MAPRLNTRNKPSQRAVPTGDAATTALGGDGRALKPSDNRKAVLEAEEAQLLSFVGRLKAKKVKVDEAKAALKVETDEYTEIVRLAGIAGFKKYELKGLMEDLGVKRKDLTETEARRTRFRSFLGLPVGNSDQQLALATETEKGELEWEADGYKCGIIGTDPVPPTEAGVHGNAWLKGYHNGQARNAWAMDAAAKGHIPEPTDAPEKGLDDQRMTERREARKAKEALEKLGAGGAEAGSEEKPFAHDGLEHVNEKLADHPDSVCETCHGDGSGLDANIDTCPICNAEYDPFEATAEELERQTTRQVIHQQREAEADLAESV
jgi:hypothetical protein